MLRCTKPYALFFGGITIDLKMEEVTRFRMTTHPVEFDMYYSL
ncbi:MAG: hypothetical protein AABY83_00095 [Pseudomonadota bacterium]